MRQLTGKQKEILDKWIDPKRISDKLSFMYGSVQHYICDGRVMLALGVEDLDDNIWVELQKINDTEILRQEVDRYIIDESMKKK